MMHTYIHAHTQGKFGVDRRVILSETDRLVVCEAALKFSLSDRGLWDTSVSHCLLCLVFTPLRRDCTGAATLDETSRDNRDGGIKAGVTKNVRMEPERDEERGKEKAKWKTRTEAE